MERESDAVAAVADEISAMEFLLRLSWVLVRVLAAFCLAGGFEPFFYQAF